MKINPILKEIIEWVLCLLVATIIALVIKYYIGTPTKVEGSSMEPTLYDSQRLWVNRWGRTTGKLPERGDIVIIEAPTQTKIVDKENMDKSNPIAQYKNEPDGLVDRLFYNVLEVGKISYIKRVIALPGEHIQIKNDYVYINGERLQEDYIQEGVITDMQNGIYDDFIVPENTVFVLGDNRQHSKDSRMIGCIPLEKIEGTLAFRFWPLNLLGNVE